MISRVKVIIMIKSRKRRKITPIGKGAAFLPAIILLLFSLIYDTMGVAVTVNSQVEHQEFEGWGTSICWWGNIIPNYPQRSRDSIMDLLFDTTEGIGLTIIRYNIGGGDNPTHNHMGTGKMMEGFKADRNAAYDWTKDAGQRWVVAEAKKRIPPEWFIAEAFSNSPPYWMTVSGCASGASGGGNNLKTDFFDDFADYLTEVVKHFRDVWGVTFRTLEPMNEPMVSWNVNGGQEGCHIDVSLQDDLIREVKAKLDAKGLSETKISAPDETSIDQTLASWNSYDATTKSCVFQINTHVYSGSKRAELAAAAQSAGKKLWDSECDGSGAPAPFDQWTHNHNDIVPGLDIANRIIRDLRDMKVNGWVFWQAVESEQTQTSLNKNWGMIHADFTGVNRYYITKKYYAVKQFSRFIKPFSKMIAVDNNDAVACLSKERNKLVIVQRNASTSAVSYEYRLTNFNKLGSKVSVWRTSANENCQKIGDVSVVNGVFGTTSPAQSITTYVMELDETAGKLQRSDRPYYKASVLYRSGILTIDLHGMKGAVFVSIYSLRGSVVKEHLFSGERKSIAAAAINLSSVPDGNYIVHIKNTEQQLYKAHIIHIR